MKEKYFITSIVILLVVVFVAYAWVNKPDYSTVSTENSVNQNNASFSQADALVIAKKSCLQGNETLEAGTYDPNIPGWTFVIVYNPPIQDSWDSCDVNAITKTAKIVNHGSNTVPIK